MKYGFRRKYNGTAVICFLLVCSTFLRVTCALKVHVTSPSAVLQPSKKVVLPCRLELTDEEVGHKTIIRWERYRRNGQSVIWRSSNGLNATHWKYQDTVEFGAGCSLVIKNPNTTDTGVYTVTVNVFAEVSENVELYVLNRTALRESGIGVYMYETETPDGTPRYKDNSIGARDFCIISTVITVFGFTLLFLVLWLFRRYLMRLKWIVLENGRENNPDKMSSKNKP